MLLHYIKKTKWIYILYKEFIKYFHCIRMRYVKFLFGETDIGINLRFFYGNIYAGFILKQT